MQAFIQQTYREFIHQHPQINQYDGSRTALGVNPGKLAMLYNGDQHVASVTFIDLLYVDGREIYIPAFDKKFSSVNSLEARMETHSFLEKEVAKKMGLECLRSGYTDVYPQCPMYWDVTSISCSEVSPAESIEDAPIESPAEESEPKERNEIQLSFF